MATTFTTISTGLALLTCAALCGCDDSEFIEEQALAPLHDASAPPPASVEPAAGDEPNTALVTACSAGTYEGNFEVYTPEDLEVLADYSKINGNLYIMTDLSVINGPDCLEEVTRNFVVTENAYLKYLKGFNGLQRIGGELLFDYNSSQTSSLTVEDFDALEQIGAMTFHSDVPVSIYWSTMANLQSIKGQLRAYDTDEILLGGLHSLVEIGSISFEHTGAIDFSLVALETLHGDLYFNDVEVVHNDGLTALAYVGGDMRYTDTWVPMSEWTFFGIEHIAGDLEISSSSDTKYVEGFLVLESVGGSIILDGLAASNIEAFDVLTTVGGDLQIHDNASLSEIIGFSSLTTVSGSLSISENDALDELGLDALIAVGEDVDIHDNPSLSTCDVDALVNQLDVLGGSAYIADNEACD